MTSAYPNVVEVAPQLVLRLTAAVEAIDPDALGAIDGDVRRLVVSIVKNSDANAAAVLGELADLYREMRINSETHRAGLQRLMADHRRTQAGLSAYRSSGATSLNP